MSKKWILAVILALVLAVVGLAGCSQGSSIAGTSPSELKVSLNSQQEGIWVNGTGKVSAVPDVAVLRLGIEAQAVSVAEAQSQAAVAMKAVMTALTDGGVNEEDIQTQYYNIRRVTRWDERDGQEVVIGYRVTNTVTAKIREMDRIGSIIDAVVVAGGDLTRINGISFSVDDPSAYYEQARDKAMADARAKAEQLAELAEVTLGKPAYISEGTIYAPTVYRQDFAEKAAGAPAMDTSIVPGELEISLNVQVAYAILD